MIANNGQLWLFARLRLRRWLLITLLMTASYYALQLVVLVIRFADFPNYINVHNWVRNIAVIIESTPSLKDTMMIIKDEWLLEIGYMNFDYGLGISEWSLFIAPAKVVTLFFFCGLLTANMMLLQARSPSCSRQFTNNIKLANGMGAFLVALTSITMSWVVCCSTPTWIVGLAMLGLGVSTSLQLEPLGIWLSGAGALILLFATFFQARQLATKNAQFRFAIKTT